MVLLRDSKIMKIIKIVLFSLIESAIRNISGGLGRRLRAVYYSRRFKSCGVNLTIDEGVIFHNSENITVGDNVWFNCYAMVTAGATSKPDFSGRIIKERENTGFNGEVGEIIIGDESGIGAYSTIQGLGGIKIGSRVTMSSYCKVFSFSHMPNDPSDLSKITYATSMVKDKPIACIISPVVIEDGVWLGLSVSVFGGTVGSLSFVSTNSIVIKDIPNNSYASGSPAIKIKERFHLNEK